MSPAPIEPRRWPRRRWWLLIALVFAAHLGLIFAFGDRKPITPRPPAPAPLLSLAADSSELLALNDPTLFALPHRESFAGAAWLKIPALKFEPFRWTEPPRLLSLPVAELGATFARFMQTNAFAPFELEVKPAPEFASPVAPEIRPTVPARSTLHLAGGLELRRLLNPPDLPPKPWPDLLTNSVVQVVVFADGNVLSSTLLSSSGSPDADELALKTANAARFEPLRNGATNLTFGTLIFEWQTVPTNAPPANP